MRAIGHVVQASLNHNPAAIRYELGHQHSFEFVEGSLSCPIASGVDSLARPEDKFFAYYDPTSTNLLSKAVDDLQNYLEQVRTERHPFPTDLFIQAGRAV